MPRFLSGDQREMKSLKGAFACKGIRWTTLIAVLRGADTNIGLLEEHFIRVASPPDIAEANAWCAATEAEDLPLVLRPIVNFYSREINMMNDLAPELSGKKRAAWGAFKSIEDVVKRTKNTRLRAHLFDSTVLPTLTYASKTWSLCKQDERSLSVIERSVERTMLGVSRFAQVRDGIRSSDLRQWSKIKDTVLYAKQSKVRWAGHEMRMNDNRWTRAVSDWIPRDVKRTAGRPPTRWSEFFTKSLEERYDARRVPKASRAHWATLARNREKWRNH
uniref:Endonuclease-reverse transcriptase n=1 Tax=Angiostrongylus cantonensis TaxID=6313 RepID=A0A0K0DMU8_ANGCA